MATEDVTREFLERLLTDLSPGIDVSVGSPADTIVMTPILDRLSLDPTENNLVSFIKTVLQDRFPDLSFEEADVLSDAIAKPMQLLLRPVVNNLSEIKQAQSIKNWRELSSSQIDDLLYNIFYSRSSPEYATGYVRLYYSNPVTEQIGSSAYFISKDGYRFYPSYPQNISADVMLLNKEGALYYFDVACVAEEAGEEYNIASGEIVKVVGVDRAIKVQNLSKFKDGTREVTDEEAISEAPLAISERSLVVEPGIITRLRNDFPTLDKIRVVGHGDDEMTRDVIKGGSAGEIIDWGTNGQAINDHDGDNTTAKIRCALADFYDLIGPAGEVSGYLLTFAGVDYTVLEVIDENTLLIEGEVSLDTDRSALASGSDLKTFSGAAHVISPGTTFTDTGIVEGAAIYIGSGPDMGWHRIVEVGYTDPTYLLLENQLTYSTPAAGPYLSFTIPYGRPWYLRKKTLTLSDVPGGLQFEDEETLPSDEVHIGGMTDVYVSADLEDYDQVLTAISDQTPIKAGINLGYNATNQVDAPGVDFSALGVERGDTVVIEDGPEAGAYKIEVVAPGGVTSTLQIDASMSTTFTNARYKVTDEIDIELGDPRDNKMSGTTLKTTVGSNTVKTNPLIDFTEYGVAEGDYLRITSGLSKGEYEILEIQGSSNTLLKLASTMVGSEVDISFSIYRKLNACEEPVVYVDSVDLLDSNEEPTGDTIPYGKAIDARADANFSNIGQGARYTIENAHHGLLGRTDIGRGISSGGSVQLYIADTMYTVTYGLPLPTTAQGVADVINEAHVDLEDLAHVIEINDEQRLALNRPNAQVRVVASAMAGTLGFSSTLDEYNNQLLIPYSSLDSNHGLTDRSLVYLDNGSSGYYRIYQIDTVVPSLGFTYYRFLTFRVDDEENYFWEAGLSDAVFGEMSTGTMRVYFKDPTIASMTGPLIKEDGWDRTVTEFTYTDTTGAEYKFFPDQEIDTTVIPVPDASYPNNGSVGAAHNEFTTDATVAGGPPAVYHDRDSEFNFREWDIEVEDMLTISTHAICGTVDHSGGGLAATIAGKNITIDKDDVQTQIDFDSNDDDLDDVIDAINDQMGYTIAYAEDSKYIRLEYEESFYLRSTLDNTDDVTEYLFGASFAPTDPPTDLRTVLNEMATDYGNHRTNNPGAYHTNPDVANTLTLFPIGAAATLTAFVNAANQLKTILNAHDNLLTIPPVVHATAGNHQITAPDASVAGGWSSLYTLLNGTSTTIGLKEAFNAHIADATAHALADGVNTTTNSASSIEITVLTSNVPTCAGSYIVTEVSTDGATLTVETMTGGSPSFHTMAARNIHFKIDKVGVTRLTPLEMVENKDEHNLYYMDVEVVSEGIGNAWNLPENTKFSVTNADVIGYYLYPGQEALSFSTAEELWAAFPVRFLPEDLTPDPSNYVELSGQNININYNHSTAVADIQDYFDSTSERVVLANSLAKHLLPALIRLSLSYTGGSSTDILTDDIEDYISGLGPDDDLTVYELNQIFDRRNVSDVVQPIKLVALVWESDRSLTVYRSEDALELGRRYELYPDLLDLDRS